MEKEKFEFIKATTKLHGKRTKLIVAIEELSELTKELTKDLRGEGNRDHIIEEICDVDLMLSQLYWIYKVQREEAVDIINFKIERQKERDKELRLDHEFEEARNGKAYKNVDELFEELKKE